MNLKAIRMIALIAPTAFAGNLVPPAPPRPNILLISVDDLNSWTGHAGVHPQVRTPYIDRLATQGVSFTNAHAASSVCCPSRAALFSGLRPSTSGIYGNTTDWRDVIGPGYTIPAFLRRNGYFTFGVGKLFHTASQLRDEEWDERPLNPSDESLAQSETSNASEAVGARQYLVGNMLVEEMAGNDAAVADHATVELAIAALARKYDRPFLIACGIFRPHLPWKVPSKYFELYPEESIALPAVLDDDLADVPGGRPSPEHAKIVQEGTWRKAVRAYLAAISYADAEVGRLLEALDRSPHRDNTIVVLFGDHGWHLGQKQKWRKTGLWEEATRTTLVWRVPGIPFPGRKQPQAVDLMSIYPTLAELTGLPKPGHVEGVSLVPLLRAQDDKWKPTPAITTWHLGNHAVRTERWRYLRWSDGREELYDHSVDRLEWRNLLHPTNAGSNTSAREIADKLRALLPNVNRETGEGRVLFQRPATEVLVPPAS